MNHPICAGILAGGKSSRMGRNKALLPYGGHSFLEQLIQVCSVFPEVLLSVDHTEPYAHLGVPMVVDQLEGFGPLEGIYQLLRACQSPYLLAVATDMPQLSPAFLQALAGCLHGEEDCLVLLRDGRPEPLCSIYSKGALPVLEQMRREGCHRPRQLFDQVNTRWVDLSSLGFEAAVISNINTPEEYHSLPGFSSTQGRAPGGDGGASL